MSLLRSPRLKISRMDIPKSESLKFRFLRMIKFSVVQNIPVQEGLPWRQHVRRFMRTYTGV